MWTNQIGARVSGFPELLELILSMLESDLEDLRRAGVASSRWWAAERPTASRPSAAPVFNLTG